MRQKANEEAQPEVVIINLKNNNEVLRRPIKADSAILHWHKMVIALKAQQRTLQIFDLSQKAKLKSHTMNEDVQFWKWVGVDTIGLVTESAVYHWNVMDQGDSGPVKMFDRNANLNVREGGKKGPSEHSTRTRADRLARAARSSTID